jgi:hypothetical protein
VPIKPALALGVLVAFGALLPDRAFAQFRDDFDSVRLDPRGLAGWRFLTGDGSATMSFGPGGKGVASIQVDATRDRRNIWWALVERGVSRKMDLARLGQPGHEIRIEARIRISHAPRRVNLQVLTEGSTDYHAHLMEFDIPDSRGWHTISMTTRGFKARPGDLLIGHLALMDWGLEKYRVELDYLKVDLVEVATAGPDQGTAVPYHPPVADANSFSERVPVVADSTIDRENTDVNLNDWSVRDGSRRSNLLAVGGTHLAILRWDLARFAGRKVAGHGLLELTTHSVQRKKAALKDFGLLRVAEILAGDPRWAESSVTMDSLRHSQPLQRVVNPQMIIDWPAAEGEGAKTYLTISRPVLQRLIDGKSFGLAIQPLGAIQAAFQARENAAGKHAARLYFTLER